MLWLAYSNHRRHLSRLSRTVRDQAGSSPNHPQPDALLSLPRSARWSFINEWQVQAQHNDRQQTNAFVEPQTEATASARRAFARQRHQLMYKKWSRERHD